MISFLLLSTNYYLDLHPDMFHTKLHSLRLLTFCRNHFECFTVFLVALKNKVKGKRFIINRKRGLSFYFYFPENKTKKTQALIWLKNSSLSLFFLSSFIFPISPLCLLPCSLSHLSSSQSLLVLSFPLSLLFATFAFIMRALSHRSVTVGKVVVVIGGVVVTLSRPDACPSLD